MIVAGGRGDPDRRERRRRRGPHLPAAASRSSSGTITTPPPTPKSALKKPATRPIRTRRTGLCYERGRDSDALLEHLTAAPEEAAIFLDFDGVLAPIVDAPEDAYPPPETRAELRGSRRATRSSPSSAAAPATTCANASASTGSRYVGSHGLELDRQAERWRQQIVDFASPRRRGRRRDRAKGCRSPSTTGTARRAAAVLELEQLAERARDEGSCARFGRKVLEVLPPVGSNKGTAVRHLLDERRTDAAHSRGRRHDRPRRVPRARRARARVRVAVLAEESPSCSPSTPTRARRARTSSSTCSGGCSARRRGRLAPVRERFGEPSASLGGRDHEPSGRRDVQPGADTRRDALHPRPGERSR